MEKRFLFQLFLPILFFTLSCLGMSSQGIFVAMGDEVDNKPIFDLVDNFIMSKIQEKEFNERLTTLLEKGVDINAKNQVGWPLICHVILSSLGVSLDNKMIKPEDHFFLEGKDLAARELARKTCLIALKILDNHGADIHLCTEKTKASPLHLAIKIGEPEIIDFLLQSKSYVKGEEKALKLVNREGVVPSDLAMNIFLNYTAEYKFLTLKKIKAGQALDFKPERPVSKPSPKPAQKPSKKSASKKTSHSIPIQKPVLKPAVKKEPEGLQLQIDNAHQLETLYRKITEKLTKAESDAAMPDLFKTKCSMQDKAGV